MRKKLVYVIPAAIVGIVVFIAVGGVVVRLLWNWLTPPLFGWHLITFWQAIALLALCRILFGGFGMRGGRHAYGRRRMRDRWREMSPEERQRVRDRLLSKFGLDEPTAE
ncbi:MAG TPA: hypothetical protein VHU41_16935 [Thermoanaerobaculia bacterium]|nr:hypothetical protein [Thermoanaerobaculia bacterium]